MGIPYFINALEEEDDFDELAAECRPMHGTVPSTSPACV